jgi:hypothetical protein
MTVLGAYSAAAVKDFQRRGPNYRDPGRGGQPVPRFWNNRALVIAFGLIAVMVLNMYGGSLTPPRSTASAGQTDTGAHSHSRHHGRDFECFKLFASSNFASAFP